MSPQSAAGLDGSSGKLGKELGVLEVFCISTGAMISSGLFVLPAVVYPKTGPSIIVAYILAAILVIPSMFSKAELATAMPKSGGIFFFIQRSLGPLLGTFAGLASWFSLSMKSAFALVGIGIFLAPILPDVSGNMVKLIAVAVTLVFTVMNVLSVKHSGRLQVIMVFGLIAILVAYIALGVEKIEVNRYVPFLTHGWLSFFSVTAMIFISFGGLTKIASVAEEVKRPGTTIPRSMFAAFGVVTLLYALTIFVTVGLMGPADFGGTLTPISDGASRIVGDVGFLVLSLAALLAFITTANSGLMAASRDPLAMAKDNLIPKVFGNVSVRLKTPVVSILTTSVFMILAITFLDLESLVKVASTMKLLLFTFANLSVILMRESRIVSYKPAFRAPLYPYLQIAGIVVYLLLIIQMGMVPLPITAGFFLLSLIWYLVYSRSRNKQVSALIHIVDRVIARPIRSEGLADELRDILIERDEIVEDRFDRLIKKADIVDVTEDMGREGLFALIAESVGRRLEIPPESINSLLHQREEESTTAIHTGLAIPHIIVEGRSPFDIMVVRSKQGIHYGNSISPVHIVFALVGSRDERNFHLQALMAIAQIVQNTDFLASWIKARTTDELRNMILLAARARRAEV